MRLTALVRNLFRRGRVDRELDEEVRTYAAMLADEHAARGMTAGEARRVALAQMGGVEAVKERVHEVRAGASVERVAQDVRFALRMLRKSPGFTAVAVLTLAVAIGATTAIFSVVDGVLVQPLPYPQADRVAFVWNHFSPQNIPHGHLSIADYLDWRAQNRAFEDPAIFSYAAFGLTGIDPPQQVRAAEVSASFFPILRVAPIAGRTFLSGDDTPSSPNLAVISESLWRTRFDGSAAAIGRPIHLGNRQATIVGVMPQTFQFPQPGIDVWTNLKIQTPTRRGPFFYTGIARLRDGVTWPQAQDDTKRVAHGIEVTSNGLYKNASMPILPIREGLVGSVRVALMVMFGAVLAVLLIGALNIANLLLARGTTRRREIAVRLSLGARRGRIVTQLMTESLVLSAAGCAAGTAVAWWGIALLRRWNADSIPRMADVRMNMHVFAFTIAAGVAAAMVFGIAPAIQSSRGDLTTPLKDGARGTAGGGPGARRLRAALVIIELALSVVLLVCSGLLLRSFARLEGTDTGVRAPAENVLTLLVSPPQTRFPDEASQTVFFQRTLEKVRALPGVESAALSDSLAPVHWSNDDTFHIIGRPWTQEAFPSSPIPVVSDDYFRVLDIPVLRGRVFDAHDTASTSLVAVVSETFARRYMPNGDPIGQQVAPSEPSLKNPPYRIIGVVADVKFAGLESAPQPVWYSAAAQGPTVPMYLLIRTAHPIAGLPSEVETAIRSIDRDVIFTHEATLAGAIGQSVARPRFRTALLALFAALALLLAAIGAYGVMAYSVSQRAHEIGVRMALGAPARQIARLVLGESARLALLGIAIGVPASLAVSRALSSLLFQTPPTDATTYATVIVILLAAVGWATIAPARRAARVDPLVALRHE